MDKLTILYYKYNSGKDEKTLTIKKHNRTHKESRNIFRSILNKHFD